LYECVHGDAFSVVRGNAMNCTYRHTGDKRSAVRNSHPHRVYTGGSLSAPTPKKFALSLHQQEMHGSSTGFQQAVDRYRNLDADWGGTYA
jgi:hypothetical protein